MKQSKEHMHLALVIWSQKFHFFYEEPLIIINAFEKSATLPWPTTAQYLESADDALPPQLEKFLNCVISGKPSNHSAKTIRLVKSVDQIWMGSGRWLSISSFAWLSGILFEVQSWLRLWIGLSILRIIHFLLNLKQPLLKHLSKLQVSHQYRLFASQTYPPFSILTLTILINSFQA